MLRDLAALRWLDAGESVILYGPVGVGKTHVAQALGHQVALRGHDIRFVKCARMPADLAGGHADRTIGQRMREYTRPAVLNIDDFAMREHTTTGSDDLYDLVSDRAIAAKPVILTSNRTPKDWYPLFPNPSSPNHYSTDSSTPATRSSWTARPTDHANAPDEHRKPPNPQPQLPSTQHTRTWGNP